MAVLTHNPHDSAMAISSEEKEFFVALGERIAQLRREQSLTQQQLAEAIGTTQQQVASYEVARLRVPVSLLPRLARTLGVSVEALIGEAEKPAKRGPSPKLLRHLERISQLPKPRQRMVMQMIEAVLAQASH